MDNVDILIDTYTILKEYIPSKDRQAAADHLVGTLGDHDLSDSDMKALAGTDSFLKRAFEEYLGENIDSDLDDDYDDDYYGYADNSDD